MGGREEKRRHGDTGGCMGNQGAMVAEVKGGDKMKKMYERATVDREVE